MRSNEHYTKISDLPDRTPNQDHKVRTAGFFRINREPELTFCHAERIMIMGYLRGGLRLGHIHHISPRGCGRTARIGWSR